MSHSTMSFLTSVLLLSCAVSGCGDSSNTLSQTTENTISQLESTKVFVNGQVYTVNTEQPWAQAVVIQENKIIYVGDNDKAKNYVSENTQIIDLQDKMLLPGFHDVHIHPLESASEVTQVTLPSYASEDEYIELLYEANVQNPDTSWLIGYGHEIATLLDMQSNPLFVLDEAVSDRPVIIMEQTSHSMWVNSKALAMAGITQDSSDPIGGVLGRDEQGNLNGILYDNAGNQVMELAMRSRSDAAEQDYLGLLEYTMPELNKVGITSISDARTYWQRGHLQTWQRVADENKLTLRVSLGLWAYPQMSDEKQLASLKSLFSRPADSLLKVDQVKFYMDGILVNSTAAMHESYEVNWLNLYENKGLNYFTQSRLEKYIKALEPVGFDFNIHGIGDRGIHEALNAVENASKGTARHRVTHLEVVDPVDFPRFAKLNVIADAQVAGEFSKPAHWPENIPLIGIERSQDLVPIKSLQNASATLTLSSDWNVSTFNPFIGLSHAISRAPQNITLAQAIAAYTINGAYAMRQEHLVGSIEVGKRADLIVLDKNLFELDAEQVKQAKVVMTLLEGEIVYQSK
ncbi:N-substituted formamide deformylase [Pseudoalteromonas holothuriae]|uniref:N-substituted formamide deformylase n=1 Tax=Pseudoalteromonas holothuriae TaxID=2963714 RepID=A0A9W4R1B8_9GAMM|nr:MULTISPECIES: amidohydrolase [unclassified Pseudoalteromonas]CAH9063669.1 N-substituted formamide deformylase [Pseudoalteromonas sp. CIP111854]CAH9064727.1 N-substituted formamide deformylase [Pseudoalteromonas sp. CIP111951]